MIGLTVDINTCIFLFLSQIVQIEEELQGRVWYFENFVRQFNQVCPGSPHSWAELYWDTFTEICSKYFSCSQRIFLSFDSLGIIIILFYYFFAIIGIEAFAGVNLKSCCRYILKYQKQKRSAFHEIWTSIFRSFVPSTKNWGELKYVLKRSFLL